MRLLQLKKGLQLRLVNFQPLLLHGKETSIPLSYTSLHFTLDFASLSRAKILPFVFL